MINAPVELRLSEIIAVTDMPDLDFRMLPLGLKRQVATFIMMMRGDRRSMDIADLLRANNPNMTNFAVLDDIR